MDERSAARYNRIRKGNPGKFGLSVLDNRPEVGDLLGGYVVTEVREDGFVFGMKGTSLPATFERDLKIGFRPGIAIAVVKEGVR